MSESFVAVGNDVIDESDEMPENLLRGNVAREMEEFARKLRRLQFAVFGEVTVEIIVEAAHRSRELRETLHRGFWLARLF